jgi:hypothetical protein
VQPAEEAKDGEGLGQPTIEIKGIVCKHCKQAMVKAQSQDEALAAE